MPTEPDVLPEDAEHGTPPDYFIDMIQQLAEHARALGEIEVAIHLDATVEARRHALGLESNAAI
jgi:hypothetical protein